MKKIYVVPHSHYDVVWAFTKEDYLQIYLFILKRALGMMERCKEFTFLIEQTYPLELIEEREPELFAQVEEKIRSGQIEISDGQYLMPDPMIPGSEVLVREILYGKRYCKERFGVEVPVAWAADGFGLNAQLPQIYKKSGYKWLSFRRGIPKTIGYRVSEFIWKGLDGTGIIAHWMPKGYRAGLWMEEWEDTVKLLSSLATSEHILMPCGSGGVPPQDDVPENLAKWNEDHEDSQMQFASPRDFFEAFEKDAEDLVEYQGELYSADLENIFPDVVFQSHEIEARYQRE